MPRHTPFLLKEEPMKDVMSMLNALHRPRLMIRAARIGAQDYRRQVHLPRLLGCHSLPRPASAIVKLIEAEAVLEDQRRASDAAYSLLRHLDLLIALMGEARNLRALATAEQPT